MKQLIDYISDEIAFSNHGIVKEGFLDWLKSGWNWLMNSDKEPDDYWYDSDCAFNFDNVDNDKLGDIDTKKLYSTKTSPKKLYEYIDKYKNSKFIETIKNKLFDNNNQLKSQYTSDDSQIFIINDKQGNCFAIYVLYNLNNSTPDNLQYILIINSIFTKFNKDLKSYTDALGKKYIRSYKSQQMSTLDNDNIDNDEYIE